jgi:type I restriction enzyme S subunit
MTEGATQKIPALPWNTHCLNEVTTKIADRDHFTPQYVEHGIPMISPSNFDDHGRIDFCGCKYITNEAHLRNRRKTDILPGDVLFTRIGTVGKACLVTAHMPEFSLLHSAVMIRANATKIAPAYLLYALKGDFIQSQIGREIQSIGVPDLGLDKINAFSIALPPLSQQLLIAKILATLDGLIEKTEALIAKYQAIKQGMMHDLFTRGMDEHGHLRPTCEEAPEFYKQSELGWIPKEWRAGCIGHCLEGIDGGWSPECIEQTPPTGEWGILKVSAVTSGEFLLEESKTLPSHLAPRPEIEVEAGDVLIARSNGVAELVGVTVQVEHTPTRLMLSDKVLRLRPNIRQMDAAFLELAMKTSSTRRQVLQVISGSSGQRNISQAEIRNLKVAIPSLEEQRSIAGSVRAIVLQQRHEISVASVLQMLKTALMQDLLTGKVRVKVDEKDTANV